MFAAFTHGVIHSLLQPPPDIEALRVYLLLPECSVYQNGEQFENIVIPFSEAILRLSTDARKVLSKFARQENVLKSCQWVNLCNCMSWF